MRLRTLPVRGRAARRRCPAAGWAARGPPAGRAARIRCSPRQGDRAARVAELLVDALEQERAQR